MGLSLAKVPGYELQTGAGYFVSYSPELLNDLRGMEIVDRVWIS